MADQAGVHPFLGYGPADFDRGTICTDQRVIVLGCGELRAEEGHIYNVPLPPALSGNGHAPPDNHARVVHADQPEA